MNSFVTFSVYNGAPCMYTATYYFIKFKMLIATSSKEQRLHMFM